MSCFCSAQIVIFIFLSYVMNERGFAWLCGSCLWIRCKIRFTRPPWGSGDVKISAASYGLTTRGPELCDWKQTTWRHLGTCGTFPGQLQKTVRPAATVSPKMSGSCKFCQYMPSKPAKYGIKIFWMCDARVPSAIDVMVHTGRDGEDAQSVVQQLCRGIRRTGRNIIKDNFFTRVPPAEELLDKNLTTVGTLRRNETDTPPITKPSESREIHSSEFGFSGNMTAVSSVQTRGKAAALSAEHDETRTEQKEERTRRV